MVAISMYRGNLHKVPDVPRRWRMPDHNLSFKDFKSLLHRRKRALSRLSNPTIKTELLTTIPEEEDTILPEPDRPMELDNTQHEVAAKGKEIVVEEVESEIEKEQREVEERLQVLNAKKHNFVQVLKQILNAEEELKRRSVMQQQGVIATRPNLPLHVDVSNDGGHMEGGETDDAGNHNNAQSRTVLRLCGASSSSESPLRRVAAFSQHNMVPHPSRGSPRIGPPQPVNPSTTAVTVSASGTNYIVSSPSPAGSGGTSVFRESRLQSPWN